MEIMLDTPDLEAKEVGNKVRNLSRLITHQFRVPPGMVLPLRYFTCAGDELQNKLAELPAIRPAAVRGFDAVFTSCVMGANSGQSQNQPRFCVPVSGQSLAAGTPEAGREAEKSIRIAAGEQADVQLLLGVLTGELASLTYQKTSALNQLIRSAREYPDFRELTRMAIEGIPHPWAVEFNAFIHKYGYELPHPLALHLPTLAESADTLLARIGAELDKSAGTDHVLQSEEGWRTLASSLESTMNESEIEEFRALLTAYRGMLARTEEDDYLLQKGAASVRQVLLEIEARLKVSGAMMEQGSIFMWHPDELSAVISGAATGPDADTLQRRQEAFAAARRFPPMQLSAGQTTSITYQEEKLCGVAVSRGTARGIVHKLLNPLDRESYSRIPANAVIVAPVLTPNLTYAIVSCAAIVTEVGGFLSHGAIFAREMGIPAVVQVEGATGLLINGEEVTVDGEQGIIQRIIEHRII